MIHVTRITLFAIQIHVSKYQKCWLLVQTFDGWISLEFFFWFFLWPPAKKDDRFERTKKNNTVDFRLYVKSSKPHTSTLCKHNDKHFSEAKPNIYIRNSKSSTVSHSILSNGTQFRIRNVSKRWKWTLTIQHRWDLHYYYGSRHRWWCYELRIVESIGLERTIQVLFNLRMYEKFRT